MDWINLDGLLAHEVAHYYWQGIAGWVDEGMANTLEGLYQAQTHDERADLVGYPCSSYRNIGELELDRPEGFEERGFSCNYSLGERLFHSLRHLMGDEEFLSRSAALYRLAESSHDGKGVDLVKETFGLEPGLLETVDAWYQGEGQVYAKPVDASEPSGRLQEIGATVVSFTAHLELDGPAVTGFSATDHDGQWVLVRLPYNNSSRSPGQESAEYILICRYEDGFVYSTMTWEVKAYPGYSNSYFQWWRSTGGRPWKPGLHTAALYDNQGTKVAETSWEVTN